MNKDKEILEEIVSFVEDNGPMVNCVIVTENATFKLEVLTDRNNNVKITRRTL